jgi:hypothetical protein
MANAINVPKTRQKQHLTYPRKALSLTFCSTYKQNVVPPLPPFDEIHEKEEA